MTKIMQAQITSKALLISGQSGNAMHLILGDLRIVPDEILAPKDSLFTDSELFKFVFPDNPDLQHSISGFSVPVYMEVTQYRRGGRFTVGEIENFGFHVYNVDLQEDVMSLPNMPGSTQIWLSTFPFLAVRSVTINAHGRRGITTRSLPILMPDIDALMLRALRDWAKWDWTRRHPDQSHQRRDAAVKSLMNALAKQARDREGTINLALVAQHAREAKRLGKYVSPYIAKEMNLTYSRDPNNYARQLLRKARTAGYDTGN